MQRVPCGRPRYFAHSSVNEVHACTTLLFTQLREEATTLLSSPLVATLVQQHILDHEMLPLALASIISWKLCGDGGDATSLQRRHALKKRIGATLCSPAVLRAITSDLVKSLSDPATVGLLQVVLNFKGFHALVLHRVAHELWREGCESCVQATSHDSHNHARASAMHCIAPGSAQTHCSCSCAGCALDPRQKLRALWHRLAPLCHNWQRRAGAFTATCVGHPEAYPSRNQLRCTLPIWWSGFYEHLFDCRIRLPFTPQLDHATGIVIGSTTILGNDVYCLHGVTLGATGTAVDCTKRHPTIRSHVVLGAGCTVLGDVAVGAGMPRGLVGGTYMAHRYHSSQGYENLP